MYIIYYNIYIHSLGFSQFTIALPESDDLIISYTNKPKQNFDPGERLTTSSGLPLQPSAPHL